MAKNGLSSSIGSLRRVLEVFERHNLNVEYTPSGIDSVSLVVQSGKAASCLYSILGELQKEFRPDKLQVAENISIVAAVGRKMAFRPGISGKIFAALGENGISIRMISQGPEELNIIVGVDNADFEKRCVYFTKALSDDREERTCHENPNVTILGATGAVGREMLKILEERNFPIGELRCLASARSVGKSCLLLGEKSW